MAPNPAHSQGADAGQSQPPALCWCQHNSPPGRPDAPHPFTVAMGHRHAHTHGSINPPAHPQAGPATAADTAIARPAPVEPAVWPDAPAVRTMPLGARAYEPAAPGVPAKAWLAGKYPRAKPPHGMPAFRPIAPAPQPVRPMSTGRQAAQPMSASTPAVQAVGHVMPAARSAQSGAQVARPARAAPSARSTQIAKSAPTTPAVGVAPVGPADTDDDVPLAMSVRATDLASISKATPAVGHPSAAAPTAKASKDKAREDTEEDEDDEEVCNICQSGEFTPDNQIVFCEGKCNFGYHQQCYGIDAIPPGDKPWYCDVCTSDHFGKTSGKLMYCCHYKSGLTCRQLAINDRPQERRYAHLVCAVHIPFIDNSKAPFTTDVPKVKGDPAFCFFCDGKYGYQIHCSHPYDDGDDGVCPHAFHPVCALLNGFIDEPAAHDRPPKEYLCPEHDPSTRDGPLGQIMHKRLKRFSKHPDKVRKTGPFSKPLQPPTPHTNASDTAPQRPMSKEQANADAASPRGKLGDAKRKPDSRTKATPKASIKPGPNQASAASSTPRHCPPTRSSGPVSEHASTEPRVTRSALAARSASAMENQAKRRRAEESPSRRVATRASVRDKGQERVRSSPSAEVVVSVYDKDDGLSGEDGSGDGLENGANSAANPATSPTAVSVAGPAGAHTRSHNGAPDDKSDTESLVSPFDRRTVTRPEIGNEVVEVQDIAQEERPTDPQISNHRPERRDSTRSDPVNLDSLANVASQALHIGVAGHGNGTDGKRAAHAPAAQASTHAGRRNNVPGGVPPGYPDGFQDYLQGDFQGGTHASTRGGESSSITSNGDDYMHASPPRPPSMHWGWPSHGQQPLPAGHGEQGPLPRAKRPKLHIQPLANGMVSPGSGGGAPPYSSYPPPPSPPGAHNYSGGNGRAMYSVPNTAPVTMRLPSEQEQWLRESRDMLHAQADQLRQLQEVVRELVVHSGQRTHAALTAISSLSAAMSDTSTPQQQLTPQFPQHNGAVFAGAPPPHFQQQRPLLQQPLHHQLQHQLQQPFQQPHQQPHQLHQHYISPAPASATNYQTQRPAGLSPQYGPYYEAAGNPNPVLSDTLPPIVPVRPDNVRLAGGPRAEANAELDEVKSQFVYLMKRVDMARILQEQLAPTDAANSAVRGRAFNTLVTDLQRLGGLSRDNVKDYLGAFVRSLEAAERG